MTLEYVRLPNGVSIYTDNYDAETVSFAIYLNGGTQLESRHNNGVTHLLEHMLFRTIMEDGMSVMEIASAMGAESNAFTWWLGMCAHIRVMASDHDAALDLLCRQIGHARMTREWVAEERDVVIQELLRSMQNPELVATQEALSDFFMGEGVGLPILGTRETLERLDVDALNECYQSSLVGSRLHVVASGMAHHDSVVRLVQRLLGKLPEGSPALPPDGPVRTSSILRRVNTPGIRSAHLLYCVADVAFGSPKYFAALTRATVLGDEARGPSQLRHLLVDTGLAQDVTVRYQGFSNIGVDFVHITCSPDRVDHVAETVGRFLDAPPPIDQGTLLWAKSRVRTRVLMDSDTSSKRALMLARILTGRGNNASVEQLIGKVSAVTLEDVRRLPELGHYAAVVLVPA